jgi:ubiquinone/menaquinone biosynthesis C-methylase UbiE
VGCGTGKNTEWLLQKAKHITAIDLSDEMLALAKKKHPSDRVTFKRANINEAWSFRDQLYDLVTFSLVLEHIENLDHVFTEVSKALRPGGHVYIGELHPFKQYSGTKARFDTEAGRHVVQCFNHHVSDFVSIPKKHGLTLVDIDEHFDNSDKTELPRILTVLLQKRDV